MDDIIPTLPIEREIRQALFNLKGALGLTLECVLAYGWGDVETGF